MPELPGITDNLKSVGLGVLGGERPMAVSLASKLRVKGKRAYKSIGGYMDVMSSPGYDGRTYQTVTVAETGFYAARLVIKNNEAAGYTLDSAAVAVSATTGINPSTGAAGWVPVTWNGASSVAIPARIGVNRPSITVSDWIPIQSIARTDGGTLPLIYWRAYNATGPKSGYLNTSNPNNAAWRIPVGGALNQGRCVIVDSAVGNFASSNQQSMTSDGGSFGGLIGEFDYLATSDILTVAGLGDSITQGDGSSIKLLSWGHIACANVSSDARPVVWMNEGFSSQTTANFLQRLTDMISAGRKPNVVVYSPFSPNDNSGGSPTAASISGQLSAMAQAIDLCEANGILPIIIAPIPRGYAAGVDVYRQSLVSQVRALASRGYLVADFDAALAASPGSNLINPTYSGDSLHPNDAGNAVLAGVLQPILQNIAAAFFL